MNAKFRTFPLISILLITCNHAGLYGQSKALDLTTLANKTRLAVLQLIVLDANGKEIATGTGFLVSSDGRLVTNHHVIQRGAKAKAKAENGTFFAVEGILAADLKNDLVVLKLQGKDLPFLALGSSNKVELGERIAVIGSPLGLEGSLSEGIISAVRQDLGGRRLLQITAAISPGSSGSPVIDAEGKVIGVVSAMLSEGQSLNFAVPVDFAETLIAEAVKNSQPVAISNETDTENDPVFKDPDYQAAFAALFSEDLTEALRRCQVLAKRHPDSVTAHRVLGTVYAQLGFAEDAIDEYHKAIKMAPDDAYAWLLLGETCRKSNRQTEAIIAYRQTIKIKPELEDAWHGLGLSNFLLGRVSDAIDAFQRAVKINPDFAQAWASLALAYDDTNQYEKARRAFQIVQRLDPLTAAELQKLLKRR
jgi:tetratricopeptide (TPR) repeat protein